MEALKRAEAEAPVRIGDILLKNVAGTGVDIVATKSIGKEKRIKRREGQGVRYGKVYYGIGSGNDKLQMYFVRQARENIEHGAEGIFADLSESGMGGA